MMHKYLDVMPYFHVRPIDAFMYKRPIWYFACVSMCTNHAISCHA